MKIRLMRDARILHKAGEIVEVSPVEYRHLCAIGSAVPVPAKPSAAKRTAKEKEKKP